MTWNFFKEFIPGFQDSILVAVAPMMGIRRSTQIVGQHVYTLEEREKLLSYSDCIGLVSRKIEGFNEIPFSCTVPVGIDNLLIGSGKNVSTDDYLMYRTKAHCMVIGQAVGVASSLCVNKHISVNEIEIKELQRNLLNQNVYLGDKERLSKLEL